MAAPTRRGASGVCSRAATTGRFVPQAEEVANVRFRSAEEIVREDLAPVTPDSRVAFERLSQPRSSKNRGIWFILAV